MVFKKPVIEFETIELNDLVVASEQYGEGEIVYCTGSKPIDGCPAVCMNDNSGCPDGNVF